MNAVEPGERPLVSAVVVNLNQRDLLRACLASLDTALRRLSDAHEVVVVDNGSVDGSADMVGSEFPHAKLVALEHNTGFAGGISSGIRSSTGEWILCVNNDATVAPDAIIELLRVGESGGARVGSVAALMVFADRPDVINSAGIEIDRLGVASDRLLGEPVDASESEPVEVFGTSAGAALYRRAMLEEVPFDESFFAYYEDVDVAWRARMFGLALPVRAESGREAPPFGNGAPRIAAEVLLVWAQSDPRARQERDGLAASPQRVAHALV